jgi:hypothetical protein
MRTEEVSAALQALWSSARGAAVASVILRRQVPIRFDEEPRSWLGGLPRMPAEVDWPRDQKD